MDSPQLKCPGCNILLTTRSHIPDYTEILWHMDNLVKQIYWCKLFLLFIIPLQIYLGLPNFFKIDSLLNFLQYSSFIALLLLIFWFSDSKCFLEEHTGMNNKALYYFCKLSRNVIYPFVFLSFYYIFLITSFIRTYDKNEISKIFIVALVILLSIFVIILLYFLTLKLISLIKTYSKNSHLNKARCLELNKIINDTLNKKNVKTTNIQPETNIDNVLDYSVELLSKWPESIEAYYTITNLRNSYDNVPIDINTKQKCINWVNLNQSKMSDANYNTVEKITYNVFLLTLKNNILGNKNNNIGLEVLTKIKKGCENKQYRALAAFATICGDINNMEEFIKLFPDTVVTPLVELDIAGYNMCMGNFHKCINETMELLKKYNDLKFTSGRSYEINCYSLLVTTYFTMKDYINANKYLLLIKEKAPKFYQENFSVNFLNQIKEQIREQKL